MESKACLLLLEIVFYSSVLMWQCSNATGCSSAEFQCTPGHCIHENYVCDGEDDCPDSSDEAQCDSTYSNCKRNEFPCTNGRCIPYEQRCDGDNECGDYSDEECDPFLDNFLIVAEIGDHGKRKDLYQIHLSNQTMVPLKVNSPKINAVAFDGNTKTVYWTDVESGTIRRYSLTNGDKQDKSIEIIYTAPLGAKLEGLALDVDNDSLYYCQTSSNSTNDTHGLIGKMSLNGENHRVIVSEPGGKPRSIVLDKVKRLMYWTDWGSKPMIQRAAMEDGSDRTVLVNTDVKLPNALAIDFAGDILYWGDAGFHRIESISLSGRGNRSVLLDESSTNASYFFFALSSNYLYATDRKERSVRKFDIRKSKMTDQIPSGIFGRLNGIVYYSSTSVPKPKKLSSPTSTTTFKTTVGSRRKKTTSVHDGVSVTTADMLSASQAVTDEGPESGKQKSSRTESSVTIVIAVIVVGVVVMTCVIIAGVGVLKAKRTRNRLLLNKREVPPSTRRDSYDYSQVIAYSEGRGSGAGAGAGAGGGGSAAVGRWNDGEIPSSSSASAFLPRYPFVRPSSSQPILYGDRLALNNVYSTIAGDYENFNPYEVIDD